MRRQWLRSDKQVMGFLQERPSLRGQPSVAREPPAGSWLQRAAKLDWTKCPEVGVMRGKNRRLLVLMGTLAPLAEVLQSIADEHPVEPVAEAFGVQLPQLTKVWEFAGAARAARLKPRPSKRQ
jgi:hypothetical protein